MAKPNRNKTKKKSTKPISPKQKSSQSVGPTIGWNKRSLHLLVVLVLAVIALIPMLWNGFTNWDDLLYVTENNMLQNLDSEGLKKIFSTPLVSNYHPLTVLSLAFNYQVSELAPFGYHLTSLLLHLVNTAFVYFFIYKLSDKRHWVSLAVAFFFAIHPMHVESVAWISERKDLLYTMFFVGAMIIYLDYLKIGGFKRLILVGLLFVLSLLSKPAAVVLPVVLLLLDYYKKREFKPIVIIEKIPFFILAVIFGIIAIQIQSQKAIASLDLYSFVDRIQFAGFGFLWYSLKVIVPYPLSGLHPFPAGSLNWLYKLAPFVSLGLCAFILFKLKSRLITFSLLFYGVTVALVLQLLSVGSAVVAERYTYVPYIGVFFLVAMLIEKWYKKADNDHLKKLVLSGLVVLGVGFSVMTFFRTQVWENSLTLWNNTLETYPTSHRAWTNRGLHYYAEGEYKLATEDMNEALMHKPNYATGIEWQGKAFYQLGNYKEALKSANLFLKYKPNMWQAHSDKAKALGSLGRFEQALKSYSAAYKLNANNTEILNNRGTLYFNKMKQYDLAIKDFNRAIRLDNTKGLYFMNRARCHFMLGDKKKAQEDAKRAEQRGSRIPQNFRDLLK